MPKTDAQLEAAPSVAAEITPEMGMAMLKQKRLHAIERRALADEEIRITEAQIAGFETALQMLAPKAETAPSEPAGDPAP